MADEVGNKKVVLLSMDGSHHAQNALNWYVKNIQRPQDSLVVLHCAEYETAQPGSAWLMAGSPSVVQGILAKEEQRFGVTEDLIQQQMEAAGITGARIVRKYGHAGEVIVKTAEEENAAVIITGSRGMGKIRRTLLGSVSDYVIHHSHIPVIVCKG